MDEKVLPEIQPVQSKHHADGNAHPQTSEHEEDNADDNADEDEDESQYPKPWAVAKVMVTIYLASFLVALVRSSWGH